MYLCMCLCMFLHIYIVTYIVTIDGVWICEQINVHLQIVTTYNYKCC
jgi:hypothetical protein